MTGLPSPDVGGVPERVGLRIDAGAATTVGRREHNQDRYCITGGSMFMVADGVGGVSRGEEAAKAVLHVFEQSDPDEELSAVIAQVRSAVLKSGGESTVVAARIDGNEIEVRHVGDSRAYLYTPNARLPEENFDPNSSSPSNHLSQLTEDHSMVRQLYRQGVISRWEMREHPDRNKVTRVLGSESDQEEVVRVGVRGGDVLLLCSDGVSNVVPRKELEEVLAKVSRGEISSREAAEKIVARVDELEGRDNATALVVRLGEQQWVEGRDVEGEDSPEGIGLGPGGAWIIVASAVKFLVTPGKADKVNMALIKGGKVRSAVELDAGSNGVEIGRQKIDECFGVYDEGISRSHARISVRKGRIYYESMGLNPDQIIPIEVVSDEVREYGPGEIAVADLNKGRVLMACGSTKSWVRRYEGVSFFEWKGKRRTLPEEDLVKFGRNPGRGGVGFGTRDEEVSREHGRVLVVGGQAYFFVMGKNGLRLRLV